MKYLIVDTETTGLDPTSEILEIAIIDNQGTTLLDTYVTPVRNQSWPGAEYIHGISPSFIFSGNFPTMQKLGPQIGGILNNNNVVIYNAEYDSQFLRTELENSRAYCAMNAFAEYLGEWDSKRNRYKWQKLVTAAEYAGHVWNKKPHCALGDCFATLSVMKFLEQKGVRVIQ